MKKQSIALFGAVTLMLALSACGGTANLKSDNLIAQLPGEIVAAAGVNPQVQPAPSGPASELLAAYEGTLEGIYNAVNPSVVGINVLVPQDVSMQSQGLPNLPEGMNPFGNPGNGDNQGQGFGMALGSGFVWDQQGHIVTNNHVVSGAERIEVTFSDGTIVEAKMVGADPNADLAVIQVDPSGLNLKPVQLADSTR